METIHFTIDESLFAEIQQATTALQLTQSDFMKVALERALQQQEMIAREIRDADGYAKRPQSYEEVEEWEAEQHWDEI